MAEDQKPESGVRDRSRPRRVTRPTKPTTPKTASPTRSIEPGIVHYKIAQGLLEGLRDRAQKGGINLDVGEFPDFDEVSANGDDPAAVSRLVAHAVARVGDRFTFLRRFSRHMEGQEKRAGILSDLVAALWALYKRNPDAAETLARSVAGEMKAQRDQRKAQNPNAAQAAGKESA